MIPSALDDSSANSNVGEGNRRRQTVTSGLGLLESQLGLISEDVVHFSMFSLYIGDVIMRINAIKNQLYFGDLVYHPLICWSRRTEEGLICSRRLPNSNFD